MMSFAAGNAGCSSLYTVAKTMDREGGGTARFSFRIDGRVISAGRQCSAGKYVLCSGRNRQTDQSGIGGSRNDFNTK